MEHVGSRGIIPVMAKHPKRPRDPAQLAKLIVDIATGEVEDREPTPEEQGKDPCKKIENHAHSVALMMTYYNFVRIHQTLRVTLAMAAGVTDRLWEVADIVALVDAAEAKPAKRGPYRKREAAA